MDSSGRSLRRRRCYLSLSCPSNASADTWHERDIEVLQGLFGMTSALFLSTLKKMALLSEMQEPDEALVLRSQPLNPALPYSCRALSWKIEDFPCRLAESNHALWDKQGWVNSMLF